MHQVRHSKRHSWAWGMAQQMPLQLCWRYLGCPLCLAPWGRSRAIPHACCCAVLQWSYTACTACSVTKLYIQDACLDSRDNDLGLDAINPKVGALVACYTRSRFVQLVHPGCTASSARESALVKCPAGSFGPQAGAGAL